MAAPGKLHLKPLYLTWQPNITTEDLAGVFYGLRTMKRVVARMGKFHDLRVCVKGAWRAFPYFDWNLTLIPGKSVAWIVDQARAAAEDHKKGKEYLYANTIAKWQKHDPWQEDEPHFHLMVVKEKLYCQIDDELLDCSGACFLDVGAVLTLDTFAAVKVENRSRCNWALTLHEIGHTFDAVPDADHRTEAVKQYIPAGPHCTNECVMQLGLSVKERVKIAGKKHPYCMTCLKYMEQYLLSNSIA